MRLFKDEWLADFEKTFQKAKRDMVNNKSNDY